MGRARWRLRSAKRFTAAGCAWCRARSGRSRPRIARAGAADSGSPPRSSFSPIRRSTTSSPPRHHSRSCRRGWRIFSAGRTRAARSFAILRPDSACPEPKWGVARVCRRGFRPDHDCAFLSRGGVWSRAAVAWRDLRGARRLPGREARCKRDRARHRCRAHGAQGGARPTQLPQSRRAAAIQGTKHHHRIRDQIRVRCARGGGARGLARARRARDQGVAHHRSRIALGARFLRGAAVVRAAAFAVPGDLATPTGGYTYDRRIIGELGAAGWQIQVVDLGEGFPHVDAAARGRAIERIAALPGELPVVVDGLAFGVLDARALARSHRLIALVHHPLALESGLSEEQAAALRASERAALASTRHVIASSPSTARLLVADYAVAADRISIVPPGT